MTRQTLDDLALSRPEPAPDRGPLDDRFYDLVEARFRRILRDHPDFATFIGIHTEDHRLGSGERDAVLAEIAAERAHLTAIEALDPGGLSVPVRFERDLEIHNLKRDIFDAEVVRIWERRSTALDGVGDPLFGLFARDFAPLPERLDAIASRLEATPAFLDASRSRAVQPQVRLWQTIEIETAGEIPSLFDEVVAAGEDALGAVELRRLKRAADGAKAAVTDYRTWLESTLADGTDDWALGRERYDELVGLRAFDGLDADAILAIGEEQLALNSEARVAAAREIDPSVPESTVVDRIKSDHPATFEAALAAYRDVMVRARRHLIERDIVTVPDDERIEVIPTPEYIRNVIPFAAYFDPPKFDTDPNGIYIVTPSVGDDPNAMREHNYSSISNTSIHEAYPGHHLQLSVAGKHPSLTRALTERPGVRRGLGDVLRADDARAGLRRRSELPAEHVHRRDLAGMPDHPRRPDAPRRAGGRREHPVHGRADQLRGGQRASRGPALHLHADLPAELSARQGAPPPAPGRRGRPARDRPSRSSGSTTRCCATASLPISFHRRLLAETGGGQAFGGGSGVDRAAAR